MLKDKAEARISPLVTVKSVDTCYFFQTTEADSSPISQSQPGELHLSNEMIYVNRGRRYEISRVNFIGQISHKSIVFFDFSRLIRPN